MPLEQVARDGPSLDLVGALIDPEQPEFAIPALDRQLAGVAHPAMHLQDPVDDLIGLHAAVQLGHRLSLPRVEAGVDSRQAPSMAKLYGGVKANEIVDRVLQ